MDVEKERCIWCLSSELYKKYHDEEWGIPVYDDNIFFEFLLLETFQAGLSWITILNKRENFKKAFDNFDYKKIAIYTDNKILDLLQDAGIIRNKLKVYFAVINAQNFLKIQEEYGSFSEYIWKFVDNKPLKNFPEKHSDILSTTLLSDKISKDLKRRGFKFVGSTVIYAFMQATGIVNDHVAGCFRVNNNLHPD
ncbi:MAG: DNA-3-methyladenine glycosylase I [Flavobacterium sp.]|nr:DNA-3-methyladenine glycosylase I [Flavobacterium sp.]